MEDDELTEQEKEMVERDGISGEEAHRAGEFDDLRDRMERLQSTLDEMRDMISSLKDDMREGAAVAIESGAVITEGEEEPEVLINYDSIEEPEFSIPLDDLDLTIE